MERPRSRRRRGAAEGWRRVKDCLRQFVAFMFSNVGIVGLVIGYAIAGAFLFQAIEKGAGGSGGTGAAAVVIARGRVVRRLWDATTALVFTEAEWRALAAAEVAALQRAVVDAALENGLDASPPPVPIDDEGGLTAELTKNMTRPNQWSFSGAFLYSLTVITTIGYGNVAPQTEWGKLVTILYAIAGMPLFLLYLSNIGDILAKSFKWTYAQLCLCRWCNSSGGSSPGVKASSRSHRRKHHHHSKRRRPSRTSLRRRASVWSREVAAARGGTAMAVGGGGVWPSADSWPPEEDMMDGDMGETEDEDSDEDSTDDSSSSSDDDSEDTDGLEGVDGARAGVAVVGSGVVSSGGGGGSTRSGGGTAAATTESVTVPVSLCLAIMVGYVCGGALLFAEWEDWDFLDGSYFCFISLSTIGFGDIVPGDKITAEGDGVELSFIFCSAYLMLGMALIAMCFSLMQEEVVHKMRGLVRAAKAMGRCLCGGGRRRGEGGGDGRGGVGAGGGAGGSAEGDIPLEERSVSMR